MESTPNISGKERKSPRLSVIVPVYNAAPYLEESVQSVLNQTLTDIEILLVDDKSTDGSAEICDRLATADARIKAFHMPENKGPGVARNVALDYADGDYCTFMDSDDLVHPEAYETAVAFAAHHGLDVVRFEMGRFSDDNPEPTHIFHHFGEEKIFSSREDMRQIALCVFSNPVRPGEAQMNFGGSACSAIYHRSLFEKGGIRFPRRAHMLSEDFILCFQTALRARAIGLLPRMFYYYRDNQHSRTRLPRLDLLERAYATAEYMDTLIQEEGFPEKDRSYALGFAIDITRAFVKNIFLSDMSLREKREWFEKQHDYPILERCWKEYPLELLPHKFRVNFEAFYKKQFWRLMTLIRGREMLRRVTGR